MIRKGNLFSSIKNLFNEFLQAEKQEYPYNVVGIETHGHKKIVVVQLSGRLIQRKTPEQIILDDSMIEGFSPKAVRTITYLAVLERVAPKFQLVGLELNQKLQEYRVTLKNYCDSTLEQESASYISKSKVFVGKLSPEDANRIGYMAGLNDAVKEGCSE